MTWKYGNYFPYYQLSEPTEKGRDYVSEHTSSMNYEENTPVRILYWVYIFS